MATQTDAPLGPHDLVEEHVELNRRIERLREWFAQLCELGQPRFGEMATRLQEIRSLLVDHFASEEEGGYLAEALRAAPQFTRQAAQLQQQHRDLLQRLDLLTVRLTASPPDFRSWNDACDQFEDFVAELREHEHAENQIAQAALETDVGNAN